jgi:antirestriction protein ArdC
MSKGSLSDVERAEYRDAKRAEQRELVEHACRELLSSEGWRKFAETRATFHRYSFGNCMLIAMQRPDAEQVAGFKAWQQLGRQVRKGEKAIRILAPMVVKEHDANGSETGDTFTLFRAVPVFDVSQTDGEPLAQPPREPITGDSHAAHISQLERFAQSIGFDVAREDLPEGCGGYCNAAAKRIVIATHNDSGNAVVRVLVHELAHALGVSYADYGREVAEVIVETATVVVCGALGLDTSGESIPYIAGWGEQDLDAIRRHAEKVDEIARTLEVACGVAA